MGLYYWTFKVLFLQPHVHGFINLVRFSGIIKLLTFFVAIGVLGQNVQRSILHPTPRFSPNILETIFYYWKIWRPFKKNRRTRRSWSDRKLNFLECEKNGKIRFNVRFELPPLQFFLEKGKVLLKQWIPFRPFWVQWTVCQIKAIALNDVIKFTLQPSIRVRQPGVKSLQLVCTCHELEGEEVDKSRLG